MPKVHASAPIDPLWCYELVSSTTLPKVDLSVSIKSHYLPERFHPWVAVFLRRFQRPLEFAYMLAIVFCMVVPYIKAVPGGMLSILTLIFALPLGIGSIGALRLEVVRIVLGEDNVWFFCFTNLATQVLYAMLLGDIRVILAFTNFISMMNVVLIDARLRGIRHFTYLASLGLVSTVTLLVCLTLNLIDKSHGTSLWQYNAGKKVYVVSVSDYVVNGYSTLGVLLAKILYRKRKSMRRSTRNTMIECAVFRCPMKLRPYVFQQVAPQEPLKYDSAYYGARHVQQLRFLRTGISYDARKIMIPSLISSTDPYPYLVMLLLHLVGVTGFVLMTISSHLVNKFTRATILTELEPVNDTQMAITVGAFACTLMYWLAFAVHHQRDLLQSLITSFDFVFYSLQVTVLHITAAILDGWSTSYCLWLAASWLWTHWLYCLDALTPVIKSKLRFRVRWAIPVVALVLLRELVLLSIIFVVGVKLSEDHSVLVIGIPRFSFEVNLLPFFVGRLLIVTAWTLRLLARLVKAGDADVIILRGAVTYENYMSGVALSTLSRVTSRSRRETVVQQPLAICPN